MNIKLPDFFWIKHTNILFYISVQVCPLKLVQFVHAKAEFYLWETTNMSYILLFQSSLSDEQLKELDTTFEQVYTAKYPVVGYMSYLIDQQEADAARREDLWTVTREPLAKQSSDRRLIKK